MKLAIKLSLLFLLVSLISILIISYLSYYSSKTAIKNEVTDHLTATNLLKEAEIERWLKDSENLIEVLAKNTYFKDELQNVIISHESADPAHMLIYRSIVKEILMPGIEGGGFFEFFIIRPGDGLVLISTDEKQKGKYQSDQLYFINGKDRTFIQNVYYSMAIQQPAMTVGTPLKDRQGNLIAVLAGHLNLSELSVIMEKGSGLRQTEDTYLVNNFNFFITEPRFGKDYALKKTVFSEGVMAALKHNSGIGFYNNYRNIPVIGAYHWMSQRELCLITEVSQAEAFAPVYELRNKIIFIGIGVILLAGILGWLISLTITRPMNRLVDGTRKIGAGDLDYRFNLTGTDEISRLSIAFDQMTKKLKKTLVSRDKLSEEVSVRKRTEKEALQANIELTAVNKEIEAFSYSVSHDLRAPLRHILGFVELLQKSASSNLDEKSQRYIGIISESAKRMGNLIDDLLALSRVGRLKMIKNKINLSQLVKNTIKGMDEEIKGRDITWEIKELPEVYGDSSLLGLVFTNLISNAVKFTRKCNQAKIEINYSHNKDEFVFFVKDNGAGFDMNYSDKLFEAFQRLHSQEEFEGTGIGLVIVHRIINRHGGHTWAEGKVNNGATFYFSIPKQN